jgi:hypothetical protein
MKMAEEYYTGGGAVMLEPMWFHCVGAGLQVDSVFIEVDQTV